MCKGHTGWISTSSLDFDGDGCHDEFEDNDEDGDGVFDNVDAVTVLSLEQLTL